MRSNEATWRGGGVCWCGYDGKTGKSSAAPIACNFEATRTVRVTNSAKSKKKKES